MPEYEYQCLTCGKEFSVRMAISEHEAAQVSCPHCQSGDTRQILSTFVTHTRKKS